MFCPVLIITLSSLLSRNFLPQNPIHTWQKSKSPLLLTLQSISHCRPFNHTDLINKESQRALKYDLLCSSALFFLIIIFAFDLLLFLFFSFFSLVHYPLCCVNTMSRGNGLFYVKFFNLFSYSLLCFILALDVWEEVHWALASGVSYPYSSSRIFHIFHGCFGLVLP